MRVVVVGGSGNVGTAVLEELARTGEVSSVHAVARRFPDRAVPPYDTASWQTVDVAAADARTRLADAFRGADTVIHLAWAIQPSHRPDLLERINVEGTRNVVEAALAAEVGHVVYASSVGAYAPADRLNPDTPVDEDWLATGVPGSSYSAHKAAVEQLLDRVERDHPRLTLTRLRPSLIFQRQAASEIARYFIGPFVPLRLLRRNRVPIIPFPATFRFQAVHAADAARAYASAVVRRAPGAFNIAASPVLSGKHLAELLGGRVVSIPASSVRVVADLAWRARLQPNEPGWIRLADRAPLLDCNRAERELDWQPSTDATDCLAELLDGFSAHAGTASPPMRPREPFRHRLHAAGGAFSR